MRTSPVGGERPSEQRERSAVRSRMAVEEAVPVDDVDAAARMFINGENDEDIRCLGRAIMRDLVATGCMAALESIR